MRKVIVEVRLNEHIAHAENAKVPCSTAEIVADGAACADAGASVLHFHPRGADGVATADYAPYRETITRLRERCDALIHPTLGAPSVKPVATERLATMLKLAADGARPDLVPVGMAETTEALPHGQTLKNPIETIRDCFALLCDAGITPYWDTWNIGAMRRVASLLKDEVYRVPPFLMLSMLDPQVIEAKQITFSHPAGRDGLCDYLGLIPAGAACQWSTLRAMGNLLPLIPDIVAWGGHISIGLGDYAYPELGSPSNADLVREVAKRVRDCGADLATPAEAREMLGLSRLRAKHAAHY